MRKAFARPRASTLAFAATLLVSVVALGAALDHYARTRAPATDPVVLEQRDALGRVNAPERVRDIAQWAVESRDPGGLPFVVVDKAGARLYSFDASGRLAGASPVLLGATRGDEWRADAANTPAGRFLAEGAQAGAQAVVWTNGQAALRLLAPGVQPEPGRAEHRLRSDKVDDKRISDGSLHVPAAFWQRQLAPVRQGASLAYVLPETRQPLQVAQARRFNSMEGRHS